MARPKPRATGPFIRSVEINAAEDERRSYPLNLPALQGVRTLALDPRMTIFVGENGSGKSTLIEGIAVAAGFNAEGGSTNFGFATQRHLPELARHLRLVRGVARPRTGFFLRAESFFNVATEIERLDEDPGPGGRIGPAYGPPNLCTRSATASRSFRLRCIDSDPAGSTCSTSQRRPCHRPAASPCFDAFMI